MVGNIIGAELGFWREKFIWPGNIYWLGGPGLDFAIKRKKEVKRNTSLGFVVLITKSTMVLPWSRGFPFTKLRNLLKFWTSPIRQGGKSGNTVLKLQVAGNSVNIDCEKFVEASVASLDGRAIVKQFA